MGIAGRTIESAGLAAVRVLADAAEKQENIAHGADVLICHKLLLTV
ncbi:hypothetical protein [Desulfofarcimen acetoxidans]|nr:hypothetical protein [Desulfofarcimen acetoxidans]